MNTPTVGENGVILHYPRWMVSIPGAGFLWPITLELGMVDLTYATDNTATLTPYPNPGFEFLRWEGDVPEGIETENPLTLLMTRDLAIIPVFAEVGSEVIAGPDCGEGTCGAGTAVLAPLMLVGLCGMRRRAAP